jgi:thioredoxin 1
MSDLVQSTNDNDFTKDVLESEMPVLVDFWAPWCGPCNVLAPTLVTIAHEFGDRLKVIKVNVDENPATPSKYAVRGIPALMVFKSGELVDKSIGAVTVSQLKSFIEKNI